MTIKRFLLIVLTMALAIFAGLYWATFNFPIPIDSIDDLEQAIANDCAWMDDSYTSLVGYDLLNVHDRNTTTYAHIIDQAEESVIGINTCLVISNNNLPYMARAAYRWIPDYLEIVELDDQTQHLIESELLRQLDPALVKEDISVPFLARAANGDLFLPYMLTTVQSNSLIFRDVGGVTSVIALQALPSLASPSRNMPTAFDTFFSEANTANIQVVFRAQLIIYEPDNQHVIITRPSYGSTILSATRFNR